MARPAIFCRSLVIALAVAGTGMAAANPLEIDRPMDEALARAMLNRLGFGATPVSLTLAGKQSPRQYLMDSIFGTSRLPPTTEAQIRDLPISEPLVDVWARLGPGGSARDEKADEDAKKALRKEENEFASAAVQGRLLRMANADNQGHEALLSFWLNHFSIFSQKGLAKLLAWDYTRAIETAMHEDSFEALLRASFYHPAMQIYLDNARSTASNSQAAIKASERGNVLGINENLARELLELHTLGVDAGYTQKDVQELARIITGAGVYSPRQRDVALARSGATRLGLFLFEPNRHDFESKVFLGQYFPAGQGLSEIDRALHLLATHPTTGKRIAFKLAQRFLADDPPPKLVDAMAAGYRRSGGKISATLLPLLESEAFAFSLQQPGKFKEPVDYVLSLARAACADTPINNRFLLVTTVLDMGQAPLMHTTPDGYASRESDWLSPAAMAKRLRLAMGVAGGRVPLAEGEDDRLLRLKGLAEREIKGLGKGTPCSIDNAALERAVGPLSPQTQAAAAGLAVGERAALLLASPDFMRR